MAKRNTSAKGWIEHHGRGRPIPIGTMVQVEMFNGIIRTIAAGTVVHDVDGRQIPPERSAGWSAWNYHDGGPMAPKFRAYRLVATSETRARDTAMFRSWLNVRALEEA